MIFNIPSHFQKIVFAINGNSINNDIDLFENDMNESAVSYGLIPESDYTTMYYQTGGWAMTAFFRFKFPDIKTAKKLLLEISTPFPGSEGIDGSPATTYDIILCNFVDTSNYKYTKTFYSETFSQDGSGGFSTIIRNLADIRDNCDTDDFLVGIQANCGAGMTLEIPIKKLAVYY